jgi:hypothetical protein
MTSSIALGNGSGCLVTFEHPENDRQENGNQHERCNVLESRMVLADPEQGWRGEEASEPVEHENVREVVGEVCADGKLGGAVDRLFVTVTIGFRVQQDRR